jgi:RNA polymerase sigma-70 factor (ECF subfamily)
LRRAVQSSEMNRGIETIDEGLLLRRMVAGDEAAFTLLYRRKHPSIYRFALHMSGNAAIAEDVTQEVFMTLIRDAGRFDPARGTLGGFLFGVARNHLRRRWEQERNSVPLPESADDLDAMMARSSPGRVGGKNGTSGYGNGSGNGNGNGHANGNGNGAGVSAYMLHRDDFAALENVTRVRQAIATLPENYREVVVLCELDELSYEEAAAALDCPVGTVRSRLHRARAILVEKLRDAQPVRRASAVGE